MDGIPLTRCQFLIPFADILTDAGGATSTLLAKFRLPTSLEEKADHFVPLLPAVCFARAAQASQGITEIAFRASQRLRFEHLSGGLQARVRHAPTLLFALQQVCRWAPLEDTVLDIWLERCHDSLRICSRLAGTDGIAHLDISQWLQNVFVIHVVRQFTGANWAPAVIAFESNYTPSVEVQSFWPNTRFLSGQKASWIDVPLQLLSLPNLASTTAPSLPQNDLPPSGRDIVSALKLTLPSYLDEGAPTIVAMAEMVGTSVRSLQRQLSVAGLTYSGLLEQVRFENAVKLLRNTENKIIDVAFSSGYADPAHFTRAFRRISGVTPREFRDRWRPSK